MDQARGKLFSKLANNISIAARNGADPKFNSALRGAIEQAKKQNMPQTNIDRAIKRVSEKGGLEYLLIEAYGPGGVGLLVEAVTDNKRRTIGELRSLFKEHNAKLAEPGSLLWSFNKTPDGYKSTLITLLSKTDLALVALLVGKLREHNDVLGVNASCKL